MLSEKNSLKVKIWLYLAFFSCIILIFLWLFQIAFLDTYYEISKKNDLNNIADKFIDYYQNGELSFETLAFEKGICIEVLKKENSKFLSNIFSHGCMSGENKNRIAYEREFIESNLNKQSYTISNPMFGRKTLLYGVKIDNNTYAFISSSLEPLDATTKILSKQLIYVSILVLILSIIIAYYISKKISAPIIKLNDTAKKMAKGDYKITFNQEIDISEIKELANTLNVTKEELAKTDEFRRDLMANVSHDLKTPLTMIKAYAEMVRDLNQDDPEKREKNLNIIIEETERLNSLVNDILLLSKIEASVELLNIEEFDITKLIIQIIKRYDILKEKDNYEFIFNETKPIMVKADVKKIEQVLYNLINNAINYTGEDKKVYIDIDTSDDIKISVRDTGKGIDSKDIPLIWTRYYKNKKNHQRNVIGTGLGLSIVKNILETHNFKYGVESKKGKGSTFYFKISKTK